MMKVRNIAVLINLLIKYNNTYNCPFPKDIRVKGRFYEFGENDLNTVITKGKPFFRVSLKIILIQYLILIK